jgi:large subunit ribosomal protein L1
MPKRGRRLDEAEKRFDRDELHAPRDAIELVKGLSSAKFDETVDVAFRLGVDVRKADQIVRGTVNLPHGTGKTVRVAVFADGDKAREAQSAGADIVGGVDLVERVQGGFLDFDLSIATPEMMGQVGKLGRVLGPRGLMPNPKAGTVTQDVGQAVKDFKAGKLEYRTDRHGNVHVYIGKVSFEQKKLLENYSAVLEEILRAKPAAAKGRYLKAITVSSTMGPGVKIDPSVTRVSAEDPEPVSA